MGMTNEEALTVWLPVIKMGVKDMPECNEALDMATKALEQQQDPNTGHWVGHRDHCENLGVIPSGLGAYKWCSNCDCGIDVKEWHRTNYNYCPNCGIKMDNPLEV